MNSNSPTLKRHMPSHRQSHPQTLSPRSDLLTRSTTTTSSTCASRDPQAILLLRWQRASQALAARRLSRKMVVAMNRNLDEVEELLSWEVPETTVARGPKELGLGIDDDMLIDNATLSESMTPPSFSMFDASKELQPKMIEAQQLEPVLEKVTYLVEELRKRHEEFKHLHSVTIAKAEQAAEVIVQQQVSIEQLEEDIIDDESELTYLKLKLRILEIEAAPHVPLREKDSLAEGIRRWKLDWADVDNRFRMRRRKNQPGKRFGNSSLVIEDAEGLLSFPSP